MSGRMRKTLGILALFLAGGLTAGASLQERPPSDQRPPTGDRAVEFISPEVQRLDSFVGIWNVAERHFDDRGEVFATVKGKEENTWTLDFRVLQRSYTSGDDASPYRATGMLSWNTVEKRYTGYWFDNNSTTGPRNATGEWNDDTRTMIFTLESLTEDGQTARYRVIERFLDEDQRVATTYLMQGGEVIKRMEVKYRRAAPCPGVIRPVFDELKGTPGK